MTKKIRMWCDGARTPVQANQIRGKHARCPVCGQRFIPKEVRDPETRETLSLTVPPHKAY